MNFNDYKNSIIINEEEKLFQNAINNIPSKVDDIPSLVQFNDYTRTIKNRVFIGGLGVGKNNSISLHTSSTSVYQVTGLNQIEDIIKCGYIRPKNISKEEVFWHQGGKKLYYYDKRPVLESTVGKVKDGQIGAISLNDLVAIWTFNIDKNCYENRIEFIKKLRQNVLEKGMFVDLDYLQFIIKSYENTEEEKKTNFMKVRENANRYQLELRKRQVNKFGGTIK